MCGVCDWRQIGDAEDEGSLSHTDNAQIVIEWEAVGEETEKQIANDRVSPEREKYVKIE